MVSGELCRRCDVFVGFGAVGVVRQPEGKTEDWLRTHCWVCERSVHEIKREEDARSLGSDRVTDTNVLTDGLRLPTIDQVKADRPKAEPRGMSLSTWVDPAMYEAEDMPDDMPRVTLLSATPDPLGALGAMCAMYEGRVVRDLSELTDDDRRRYWSEVQKTHLKAPLEAIDLHFMVEGVTRAFTHQMVRQRTAVFAQESMRFAVKEKIAARPGPLISAGLNDCRHVWDEAIATVWGAYQELIGLGVPAEEARGLLPHDTLTRLNFKTNLRNLADHMGNRLCTQAQFEWRLVASQIKKAIREYTPMVYDERNRCVRPLAWQFELIADSDLFQPVCFALGHCPFKASFDRGCTIRERVDAGRFKEIKPEEWLADPTAGWVR